MLDFAIEFRLTTSSRDHLNKRHHRPEIFTMSLDHIVINIKHLWWIMQITIYNLQFTMMQNLQVYHLLKGYIGYCTKCHKHQINYITRVVIGWHWYWDELLIDYLTYRHELAVTDDPVEILVNTDEILTVNKPSSIPIHPCGRYRHNSLIYILAKEHGFRNLRGQIWICSQIMIIMLFSLLIVKRKNVEEIMWNMNILISS